ncbi:N-acetyltransferase [uncultured Brevundimonas sp.]|uniref:GNAT family N-acetyltransferase n=1 Tax=uncultured Brevundimonas sp. TaxID=213418 RepID=UPI0025D60823|nr:GNAT family N-acetyltransferase [uncultured Brevundimonas sp.]
MSLPFDIADLEFRPLSDDCPRGAFSCGDRDIDRWFLKKADDSHREFQSRVTTVHAPTGLCPVGFFALSWIAERESLLPQSPKSRDYFPALHLEYVAVRRDFQGHGIGQYIMGRVLELYLDAADATAVPALTLIALNERAERFYKDLGFAPYAREEFGAGKRMLLPIQTALELRKSSPPTQ